MTSKITPYGRQWDDQEDNQTVVHTLRSDFLTTGPLVERFERSLASVVKRVAGAPQEVWG